MLRTFWRGLKGNTEAEPIEGFYARGGVHKTIGGEDYIDIAKGKQGCMVWGPYTRLGPGEYEVSFKIKGPFDANTIGSIDVNAREPDELLAKRDVTIADLKTGEVRLRFRTTRTAKYEFRFHANGRSRAQVRYQRDLTLLSELPEQAQALLGPEHDGAPQFFKARYAEFEEVVQLGFHLTLERGVVVATRAGDHPLSFAIESDQDLYVVKEVFLNNQYNATTRGVPFDVIDIGMNVGYASLYFAAMPNVRRVLSFEPFPAPFRRAQRNLARNPRLMDKIQARQVGLSDRNGVEEILAPVDEGDTISVSLRGAGHGELQTIVIEDAATAVGDFIRQARADGREVILKVDCEGSEFGVFKSLAAAGLFADVSIVMCEWHKWWSDELTAADLVDPLVANDFIVFDRTPPLARFSTGAFNAVRRQG